VEATRRFVAKSGLPFHHVLKNGWAINPIIHGPPRYLLDRNSADLCIETAAM
jgi:hypothetical protein